MKWRGNVYIDHCIPFGLSSAPKLFNILADLLAWIMEDARVSYLIHYLDDYLTMGPPGSTVCQQNLNTFTSICAYLGVPLEANKLEGLSMSLCFLGIILDIEHMEIRLRANKLARIKQLLISWLPRKRQILSLVGTLHHATKLVRSGRAFVARMYSTAAKLRKMHFVTRLNTLFRSDLLGSHTFLQDWNGFSILRHPAVSHPAVWIQTDPSGP